MKPSLLIFNTSNYTRVNEKFYNGFYKDYFNNIYTLNENDLDEYISNVIQEMRDLVYGDITGYGFWIWKPYIILQQLEKMNDGDILFYIDSHFDFPNFKMIKNICKDLNKEKTYPIFSGKGCGSDDYYWTTYKLRKCVENELHFTFPEDLLKIQHSDAGILFMKKCDFVMNFLKQWFTIMNNHKEEITYNFNKDSDNPEGFEQNRADQSVFNLLIKYYNIKTPDYAPRFLINHFHSNLSE